MRRTCLPGFARIAPAKIALLLLLISGLAFAQDVTEPALKAAFIYNIARFTEWPAGTVSAGEPFAMCILGDAAVGDALGRAVKARMLAGRIMTVRYVTAAVPQQVCQVLYVSGVTVRHAAQLIAGLRDSPVLTISDIAGFTNSGGIAQFLFEHGKLRFNVHVSSAKRAGLAISSQVLALAKRTD